MQKSIIKTANAPLPIGPYQQANRIGDILFVSGQIAIDPQTGHLITETIEAETHQVLRNVKAIVEAAGTDMGKIVKASVFVKDMHQFGRINAVYAEYFDEATAPARELVQVAELPKFVNIEISVIAHI